MPSDSGFIAAMDTGADTTNNKIIMNAMRPGEERLDVKAFVGRGMDASLFVFR
jgi:hypothetical protein